MRTRSFSGIWHSICEKTEVSDMDRSVDCGCPGSALWTIGLGLTTIDAGHVVFPFQDLKRGHVVDVVNT